MNSEALKTLPPEMQQRLAEIMQQQQAAAGAPPAPQAPVAPPAPIVKPPSLMDHLIALRQEVAAMRQEMANLGATIEANSMLLRLLVKRRELSIKCFSKHPVKVQRIVRNFNRRR